MLNEKLLLRPKAELHLHIEGTIEPEMMFQLAQRNNVKLKYNSIKEISKAYVFNNLQNFLDLYYQGVSVLITEQDFYDITYSYLVKAHKDNVTHTEIFIDPQVHSERGISLSVIFNGVTQAIREAEKNFGIKTSVIVCFLLHLSQDHALRYFEKLMDFRDRFIGIGLDGYEFGNPPSKFKKLFEIAKKEELYLTTHVSEPVEYIWEAIDVLGVNRIDHGNSILEDETLIQRVIKDNIPLTMCPLSDKFLKTNSNLSSHTVGILLEKGVKVTINSDDPAYFSGYINENYRQISQALKLSEDQIIKLINNSLESKFI
ncbi:adenosine deaminase [Francisella tularensis subsp. holarctica FSC022]|nr:adenosine deaminase [Francisella tularensis]EDO66522.1 hypothetical protein FTAG_00414 [Francisella tularensis subsp. holarctica FSC022]KIP31012.1 adenosine deaminase [Francisella tularensis subsp. holarctica]MBK2242868.1 adenosine deaminase [Francisella tularensis]MCC9171717.1 adenosine deaminase [Francisella tularensis]OCQ64141.1 adenosine deaminase [Francisella tularensis]